LSDKCFMMIFFAGAGMAAVPGGQWRPHSVSTLPSPTETVRLALSLTILRLIVWVQVWEMSS
jgi:hypothetical protein